MSFLGAMRTWMRVPPPFRREPVLVVPAEVGPERVESYVRQWCPDVVRRGDTLEVPEGFDVLGPFHRGDDADWPDHALSPRYTAAYVTKLRFTDGNDHWSDDTRHFLLYGLARRLAGLVRDRSRKPWRDPAVLRAAPNVQAPTAGQISHEALLRLLGSFYPGFEAKAEETDLIVLSDSVWLSIDQVCPSVFPLTRLRLSATRPQDIVEYEFEHDTTEPAEMQRMAEVAAMIASATGGFILDEDGFPWQFGAHDDP